MPSNTSRLKIKEEIERKSNDGITKFLWISLQNNSQLRKSAKSSENSAKTLSGTLIVSIFTATLAA